MSRSDRFTSETKKLEYFSDFMTNLDFHPMTGDIARVTNEESIKQTLRNIILTAVGERPYEDIGSKVGSLLFDLANSQTEELIKTTIENAIENYEKRISPIRVVVAADEGSNAYKISVIFVIINTQKEVTLNLLIKRVR